MRYWICYSRAVICWAMGPRLTRDPTQTGPPYGAYDSAAHNGTPASLRSPESICRRALSAAAHYARHHGQWHHTKLALASSIIKF